MAFIFKFEVTHKNGWEKTFNMETKDNTTREEAVKAIGEIMENWNKMTNFYVDGVYIQPDEFPFIRISVEEI